MTKNTTTATGAKVISAAVFSQLFDQLSESGQADKIYNTEDINNKARPQLEGLRIKVQPIKSVNEAL